jgi:hypothetical protein
LRKILSNQRITQRLVERMRESWFLRLDKVEQARDILRRLDGSHTVRFVDLLKHKEICTSDVLFSEVFDASLTLLYRVHDHVVE